MPSCPACANFVPEGSRFCPTCAEPTGVAPSATTRASEAADLTVLPGTATPASMAVTAGARVDVDPSGHYTAGTLLAQRYRIVGLLGKGGMGEVYRADDLTLAHPVALKFIPRELTTEPVRLEQFLQEARTARQIAHANVCRVYDIGETADPLYGPGHVRRFLTMEYIDGEDVATSLRRIGRFPVDKALEIARQLCAGLAAVHERGLLHRDLKPANVMLDGRGRVRLTDFGLAGQRRSATAGGEYAGTPAYMAPELLRGEPATVQSDVYALGLVLYEVFTGKRAFEAATIADLRKLQEQSRPASLSSSAGQIDPAIEEVLFRCLDPNPSRRPGSAIAVAASLPGGDPLAAALAAGETPSPAMVAAAGENQGLRPRVAVGLLAAFFVLLGVVIAQIAYDGFTRNVPLDYPPEVLANKAEEIASRFGWDVKPLDTASTFFWDADYTQFVNRERRERNRWAAMRSGDEPGLLYFHRAALRPLIARGVGGGNATTGRVGPYDPPPIRAGDREVWLDTKGRLTRFEAVPEQIDTRGATPGGAQDWKAVFEAAGLEPAWFTPAEPTWVPLSASDVRAAWTGAHPRRPEVPLRLEAAAWRGQIVFARVIGPWTRPERQQPVTRSTSEVIGNLLALTLFVLVAAGTLLLARHNLAAGRADQRGATRLGGFATLLGFAGWALQADHVARGNEVNLIITGASSALASGAVVWVLYVALEPFVRRRWPHTVITWNRLLSGRLRDPMLGRDVLIGCVLGVALAALFFGSLGIGRLVGPVDPEPVTPNLDPLLGMRFVWAAFVNLLYNSINSTLLVFSILFLLLLVLRRPRLTVAAFVVLLTTTSTLGQDSPLLMAVFQALTLTAMVFVLFRYGLVALAVGIFVLSTLGGGYPISADPSAWYSWPSVVVLIGLVAAAAWGFRLSLGGQKVLGGLE